MSWAWEITDLSGVTLAEVRPREATVTRRLNGPCMVDLTLDPQDAVTLSTGCLIRGWRTPAAGGDRILRASGRVTGVSASAGTDTAEHVTLASALDGFGTMTNRVVYLQPYVFQQVNPRDICDVIVTLQNSRWETGLRVAAGSAGPPRDRTYEIGKNIAEIVTQLAEVDDGFWFRVDPVDAGATFSELVLLYPSSGGASGAILEFGAGTSGNLSKAEVTVTPPVNFVTAFGAGDGDAQLRRYVWDQPSIAAYGLVDAVVTYTDVSDAGTLEAHARDALKPREQVATRVEVASLTAAAPRPWDDFDVGQTVTLNLRGRSPVLQRSGTVRVTSYSVRVDEDGVERLSSLDVESV